MYHAVPHFCKKWRGHCSYYYSVKFLNSLAMVNNYRVLWVEILKKELVHAAFQKKEERWGLKEKRLVYDLAIVREKAK